MTGLSKVELIPWELKENALFCCWRYELRGDRKTKVPYNPVTGKPGNPSAPESFTSYDNAVRALMNYDGIGIGIFNGYSAIDLDGCVNDDGSFDRDALRIIATMDSYTEYSPSGHGIRILFKAPGFQFDRSRYYINNQKAGKEVYVYGATHKYVTVTGNMIDASRNTIEERSDKLLEVLETYMQKPVKPEIAPNNSAPLRMSDQAVRDKLLRVPKYSKLWAGDFSDYRKPSGEPDHSGGDAALCNGLAFYTGKDADQMDRLFRQSGLMRPKWDRPTGNSTYGRDTINFAIVGTGSVYNPAEYYAWRETVTTSDVEADTPVTLAQLQPQDKAKWPRSDTGNGRLFAARYKHILKYVKGRGNWYFYNGKYWEEDIDRLKVLKLCQDMGIQLMNYAMMAEMDEAAKLDWMKFLTGWQRVKVQGDILKSAAPHCAVDYAAFDPDPFLLNCQNGTLNLTSGEFHAHKPGDMLSKIAGVSYDPNAASPRWLRAIEEVTQGDIELAELIQMALGYALSGDTRFECFFILYGPTSRNGKSTIMETFMKLMGDYGKPASPESMAEKLRSNGGGPTEELARLAGARFVNMAEPDKKLVLSAALIKTLTGNDTITARFLHKNSFEFRPQFKLFMNTNHLPQVTDVTLFKSGRVYVIPFENRFVGSNQDKGLKVELSKPESLSGILNWCVEGSQMLYRNDGFTQPSKVLEATDNYRRESDILGRFMEEALIKDPTGEVRTSEVYARWQHWCSANGHRAGSITNLNRSLQNQGEIKRKRPDDGTGVPTTMFLGYRLNPAYSMATILRMDSVAI